MCLCVLKPCWQDTTINPLLNKQNRRKHSTKNWFIVIPHFPSVFAFSLWGYKNNLCKMLKDKVVPLSLSPSGYFPWLVSIIITIIINAKDHNMWMHENVPWSVTYMAKRYCLNWIILLSKVKMAIINLLAKQLSKNTMESIK